MRDKPANPGQYDSHKAVQCQRCSDLKAQLKKAQQCQKEACDLGFPHCGCLHDNNCDLADTIEQCYRDQDALKKIIERAILIAKHDTVLKDALLESSYHYGFVGYDPLELDELCLECGHYHHDGHCPAAPE